MKDKDVDDNDEENNDTGPMNDTKSSLMARGQRFQDPNENRASRQMKVKSAQKRDSRKTSVDVGNFSKQMLSVSPSGAVLPDKSFLPPFAGRHQSMAPENFVQPSPLAAINGAKITGEDRNKLKINGLMENRNGTPERNSGQNFLKDPVFEFDDDIQKQKARFD